MTFGLNRSGLCRRLVVATLAAASLIGGFVASPADAAPKPGVLTAKTGHKFTGDIDEIDAANVAVTPYGGARLILSKENVASITYFKTNQEEFTARLAALNPKDAPGRIALGRWALSRTPPELGLANTALTSARAIDPASADAAALAQQIAAAQPKPVAPAVPTQPAAPPPPTQPTGPVEPAGPAPARRLLTAEEIGLVRVREMRETDKNVRLQLVGDVRKQLVEAGLVTQAELSKVPPAEQAMRVMKGNVPELRKHVRVVGDPASLAEYRMKLAKPLVVGCAAAGCHRGETGGNLVLFPVPEKEDQALTNFVILQKFEKTTGGARHTMIDRFQPELSLMLNYMLPQELARTPHPKVDGFRPIAKTPADPTYAAALKWMKESLLGTAPSYADIDLSTAAPAADAGPAGGARAGR